MSKMQSLLIGQSTPSQSKADTAHSESGLGNKTWRLDENGAARCVYFKAERKETVGDGNSAMMDFFKQIESFGYRKPTFFPQDLFLRLEPLPGILFCAICNLDLARLLDRRGNESLKQSEDLVLEHISFLKTSDIEVMLAEIWGPVMEGLSVEQQQDILGSDREEWKPILEGMVQQSVRTIEAATAKNRVEHDYRISNNRPSDLGWSLHKQETAIGKSVSELFKLAAEAEAGQQSDSDEDCDEVGEQESGEVEMEQPPEELDEVGRQLWMDDENWKEENGEMVFVDPRQLPSQQPQAEEVKQYLENLKAALVAAEDDEDLGGEAYETPKEAMGGKKFGKALWDKWAPGGPLKFDERFNLAWIWKLMRLDEKSEAYIKVHFLDVISKWLSRDTDLVRGKILKKESLLVVHTPPLEPIYLSLDKIRDCFTEPTVIALVQNIKFEENPDRAFEWAQHMGCPFLKDRNDYSKSEVMYVDHLLSYLLDNPQCLFPMADEDTASFMMEAALAKSLRWVCELCIPAAVTKQIIDGILQLKPDTQRPSVNLLQVPSKKVNISFGLNSVLFRKLWSMREYFSFMSKKNEKQLIDGEKGTASAAVTLSQSFSGDFTSPASGAAQFPSLEELNTTAKKSQPITPASVVTDPEAAMVQRFLANIPTANSVMSAAAQPGYAKGAASGKGGTSSKGKGGKAGGKGGGKNQKRKNTMVPGNTHSKTARRSG